LPDAFLFPAVCSPRIPSGFLGKFDHRKNDKYHIHFLECDTYNIFRFLNMKKQLIFRVSEKVAEPLQAIASTQRIAILLAIGKGEACVCHLEAALGWRQAYISQHLMALRKADILQDRREGRYVFYRLKDASLLDLVIASARLSGLSAESVSALSNMQVNPTCECPHCLPALAPVENVKTA
jgi:DNA-binding transcriptional ArsR family regulator